MESCLALSTKPQVFTRITSASSPSVVTSQPSACKRAASSSESTSLRAQPRVSSATRRPWSESGEEADTSRGYRAVPTPPPRVPPARGSPCTATPESLHRRRRPGVDLVVWLSPILTLAGQRPVSRRVYLPSDTRLFMGRVDAPLDSLSPISEGGTAMAWVVLVLSGFMETVWAVALGRSAGLTRPLPALVFVVALALSMAGLAWSLRSIPVGTGYAVWVGIGA